MIGVGLRRIVSTSLVAIVAAAAFAPKASADMQFQSATIALHESGLARQAGGHPDLTAKFSFPMEEAVAGLQSPVEAVRDLSVTLPQGFVGNPQAAAECSPALLEAESAGVSFCTPESQVGEVVIESPAAAGLLEVGLYNMEHSPEAPAVFGFNYMGAIVTIVAGVEPGDYRIESGGRAISQTLPLASIKTVFWGVPSDPVHDARRNFPGGAYGAPSSWPEIPFLSTPTRCGGSPSVFEAFADSWQHPGRFATASISSDSELGEFVFGGCGAVPFAPSMAIQATARSTESPSGLTVDLKVPQNQSPRGVASSQVKSVSVQLPKGMAVSPSSGSGLAGCGLAEIGIGTNAAPKCPAASKIGTVEIHTPLLKETLEGEVLLAKQKENPFGSLLAMYLAIKGPGFYLKLPGKIEADPQTGQLTTTFSDTPQLPFEAMHLELKSGPHAPLVTPTTCGTYPVKMEVAPWSGNPPAQFESQIRISEDCANGGFAPKLKAGSAHPNGGSFSPFILQVTRQDGESNLWRIQAMLPPGLLAKLAGVPLCGDAQAASGDCPASSQVGTTTVAAGPGSNPLYVPEAGKAPTAVYLAGPYKGAPYSLVVKVPAQAGPFDLGTVVVRNALRVDPTTTQVTAESDPLPQILEGIPITYRDVRVEITRPEFTLNPTNCSQFQVASMLTSAAGQTGNPKAPFAAANCERLGFKPTLALQMTGQTKRAGNPALTATLKAPKGQANIADTTVILPKTVFIDQRHVSGPCTRVQFAADACPASSVLGTATAWSPLLDQPLTGPVYFRSNGGERQLPDIVADLDGQIHVVLVGFIDSKKVGKENSLVRTRFASVPDAPVSKFVLKLKGGKRSLIQNSANLCKVQPKAEVKMTGQNGKTNDFRQKIAVKCGKAKSKPKKH